VNKKLIHEIFPPIIIRLLSGLYYGWHGKYQDWNAAKKKVDGYDSKVILEKVKASTLKVKEGKAAYERDSVLFDNIQYSFPVLSGLMWISALNNGRINVLDFGGSLGSTYFQNRLFLDTLSEVNWCIVEQPDFVKAGIENFSSNRMHFFYSVEECLKSYKIDVILLSSVLQYLEDPYGFLDMIKTLQCKYLIIDRTPFIKGKDRLTIQRVNPKIYKGGYPCWFFNESDFVSYISSSFEIITEFSSMDKANISSDFKGFILKNRLASGT
jgi:putative methyltransferase (TIGR04325 family)